MSKSVVSFFSIVRFNIFNHYFQKPVKLCLSGIHIHGYVFSFFIALLLSNLIHQVTSYYTSDVFMSPFGCVCLVLGCVSGLQDLM